MSKMQVPVRNPNVQAQPLFILTLNVINTITHLFIGAVAVGAIFLANILVFDNIYRNHIYLCVIGYVVLMAQAVLAMNPYNSWSNVLTHEDKKIAHWVMQVLGSILAIAGCVLQITSNNNQQIFQTAHGILGLIAMILTILSLIGGVLNIYSSRLQLHVTFVRVCHSCFGSLVLIMAFLSLVFAFHTNYRFIMGDDNANMMISLTVLALIGTVSSAFMRVLGSICQ